MSPNPEGAKRSLPFIIIGGVLVAVIIAVFLMSRQNSNSNATAQSNASANAVRLTPRTPLTGAPNPHVRGVESAAVTLEEFGDFECPACGGLDPGLRNISKDYGDRVRLIFREFPLQMHKYSFIAARAAEAAGAQGKFWEMHDMLYDHQEDWKDAPEPRDIFNSYATKLGLDVEKFKTDLERQDLADRIKQDYDRGVSLNVRGTPTLFVNGEELMPGKLPTEQDIRRAIDTTLASKGK
ncbi:MAG TPA: thioredoxin domain-containing protein [Pyrinomonadaceae bacterium]|nr:thioredoxin domain-containing protein [Pyrinomonadaceae bacterium]